VPLADGRGNGITTIHVAPADQSHRQDVTQPAEGVIPDVSKRLSGAGFAAVDFAGGGAGQAPHRRDRRSAGTGQARVRSKLPSWSRTANSGPSMRRDRCRLENCLADGLGRSRGIQPGRYVDESVDDVCIYTAHLCAVWG
jgi:hypothetical protein